MLRLILEICAGLIKAFQFEMASRARSQERNIGAAIQREEDSSYEENRIRAAGHADVDGLPGGPDPLDRDKQG